jgi:hypothetical protein
VALRNCLNVKLNFGSEVLSNLPLYSTCFQNSNHQESNSQAENDAIEYAKENKEIIQSSI